MIVAARWVFECLIALAVILFAVIVLVVGIARADAWTHEDVAAALDGASPLGRCIIWIESHNDPYAIGSFGEVGLIQLYRRGNEWPRFFAAGFTEPTNPFEAVAFLEQELALGLGPRWSAYPYCR